MSRLASTARGGDPDRGAGDSIEEVRTRTSPPGRTSTPAAAARTVASSTAAMPRSVTTIPRVGLGHGCPAETGRGPDLDADRRPGDPVVAAGRPRGLQHDAPLHRAAHLVAEQADGVGAAVELDADAVAADLVALHPVVAAAQVDPDADPVAADGVAAHQVARRAQEHDPVASVALDQVPADGVAVGPLVDHDPVVAVGVGTVGPHDPVGDVLGEHDAVDLVAEGLVVLDDQPGAGGVRVEPVDVVVPEDVAPEHEGHGPGRCRRRRSCGGTPSRWPRRWRGAS